MSNLTTRRKLLTTTAVAGTAALAGCGSGGGGGGGGSSAAFETIEIDGEQLIVQLAGDAVSTVNVIGPNGEPSLGSQDVTTGASQVSFDLLQDYEVGEHEIVAVDGEGNEIGSATQRLEPEVQIDEIVTYDMVSETDWPDNIFTENHALLTLSNTGNAPIRLFYITYDNVPQWPESIEEDVRSNGGETGLFDKNADSIMSIAPDETVTGATYGVFRTTSVDFECTTGVESATITMGYQREESSDFEISYEETEQEVGSGCTISIETQPQ